MGIEKPYEVERHELETPPGRPRPVDVAARTAELVTPTADGIAIAGETLRAPADLGPEGTAEALRALIVDRLHERRPNADEHAWDHLVHTLHGLADAAEVADEDFRHAVLVAIDGL
jgi:hypothetical protein